MFLPARRRIDAEGRTAALGILDEVEAGGGHSNVLLAALPAGMEARERSLATEIVYGVLRRRATLDRIIGRFSTRPPERIDLTLLNALRVALYQILFLTRIPVSAAVNESVGFVRKKKGRSRAAFANAVLRAATVALDVEGRERLLEPKPAADPVDRLAGQHSFPPFLVRRFVERYGESEAAQLLESMNRPAPVSLRLVHPEDDIDGVTRDLGREGITTVPSTIMPGALRVLKGSPQKSALFRAGGIYLQDEASQIIAGMLDPFSRGGGLLDMCAAPGGKILAVAASLPSGFEPVVAADRSRSRIRSLVENIGRSGIEGIDVVIMNSTQPALRRRFATILLDAPCSGTGIIRRHPEIRWRLSEESIRGCVDLQTRLLTAACALLAPGGRLVYSVCSLEPEEGPERVAECLQRHPMIQLGDARRCLPASVHRAVDRDGVLRTLPHRDDVDGFYAAILEHVP